MNWNDLPADANLIVVLGPTACGKTHFAVRLARLMNAEIISADSRQVYKGMDIGTGKDLSEYAFPDGYQVPYHLIDCCQAGEKYNLFEFQRDFRSAYQAILKRGHRAILCGGTGLYIESILKAYTLLPVPQNVALRNRLAHKSLNELSELLQTYKQQSGTTLHNQTDIDTPQRAIRAIEIEAYYQQHPEELRASQNEFPIIRPFVIGLAIDREIRRQRISERLDQRLKAGMVEEVQALLNQGIPADDLLYYGLEYKFVTLYLTGQLTYEEMRHNLEIAIHQFAKRQMTWFRGMSKRGIAIHWLPIEEASVFLENRFERS